VDREDESRDTKITIKDVAKHAGVAISTVSRVINGLDRVSDDTKTIVQRSINALGYKPNLTAVALKAKRSHAIGLICDDITSPYLFDLLKGIEHTAKRSGYSIIICNNDWDQQNTLVHLDTLMKRNIDGIIYSTPMRVKEPLLGKLKRVCKTIPFVILSQESLSNDFNRIHVDIQQGMKDMMNHLFGLGHKNIAMIAGPEDSPTNSLKVSLYVSMMQEKGYGEYIEYVYTDFSMEQGISAAKQLLSAKPGKERPTAIIGAADLSIIGALKGVKQLGLAVPGDVSMIGWGGIDYDLYTDPMITSVADPRYDLGVKAMEMMLSQDSDGNATSIGNTVDITLPVQLEVRESTAVPSGF